MLFAVLLKLLVVIFVIQGTCQGAARARWPPRNGEPGEKGDPSAGTDGHHPAGYEGNRQSQELVAGPISSFQHSEGVSYGKDQCRASSRARDKHTYKHSWGRTGSPGQCWNGVPGPWARSGASPGGLGRNTETCSCLTVSEFLILISKTICSSFGRAHQKQILSLSLSLSLASKKEIQPGLCVWTCRMGHVQI